MNIETKKYTVLSSSESEIVRKGSKFIACAFPMSAPEDSKLILERVKHEHPKARHWCYAWRAGFSGDSYRISDDGEPSGTAGKPILNQIDSKSLTNVMVVVVRYFGGILLGSSGLIKAYKDATKVCLELAAIVEIERTREFEVYCDFTTAQQIMGIFKEHGIRILDYELTTHSRIRFMIKAQTMEHEFKKVKARLDKQN